MSLNYGSPTRIVDSRHPSFLAGMLDWEKWRLTFQGGDEFRDKYLKQFTTREDPNDFLIRKELTPIPVFAKSAVEEIADSIFQRMRDISRSGGSLAYRNAVAGEDMGVDRRGSTMNAFLGMKVLTELLVMGRVGIYVDNPVLGGQTIADTKGVRPYLYTYQVEDILAWCCTTPESPSEYRSILVRDTCVDYDRRTNLPMQTFQRFRLMWLDEVTKRVNLQFYNVQGDEIDRDGIPGGPVELELTSIPFVMPDLGDSLIKDTCSYQIALLNMASRNVWYDLQSNFTFYIEQRDLRAVGGHLKQSSAADGTATTGGQGAANGNINVGAQHGRAYDKGADPPSFINPSAEPLRVSMELQDRYEAAIRKLVHLAVQTMATRSSAESKSLDNAGLEAGLSKIGLILENAERQIAKHWAAYENRVESQREVATIKYPDRYSLKNDSDRIEEASKLAKLMFSLPGREVKKEIAKQIVQTLLGGRVSVSVIDKITDEISSVKYLTSDPDTIIAAVEAGLCGNQTGSMALGFDDNEHEQAAKDQAEKAATILDLQSKQQVAKGGDAAARGVPALSANKNAGKDEKTAAGIKNKRQRGRAATARVSGASNKE